MVDWMGDSPKTALDQESLDGYRSRQSGIRYPQRCGHANPNPPPKPGSDQCSREHDPEGDGNDDPHGT